MKNWLLAGTMLLGLTAAAAPAAAQTVGTTGYVGAAYGHNESEVSIEDFGSAEGDGDAWKVEGAVALPLGSSLGLQIDGEYLNVESDGDDEADALSGTAHLFTANEKGAIGGFVGVTDADDVTFWTVGAEAQAYWEQVTLQGQLAYGQLDEFDDADFWGGRGEARFFATDNLRFDVNGGWSRISADDDDLDVYSYGVGAEYQFDAVPVSLFATYDHAEFDEAGIDVDNDTFFVGARYAFGGGTLKARDRSGARWTPATKVFGGGLGASLIAAGANLDDLNGGEGNDL